MKKQYNFLFISLILISIIFSSCEKLFEETPGSEEDIYLVSYEQIRVISQIEINAVYAQLTVYYPDAAIIKEKAANGVKVFKIKYNTKFQGEDVIASGLVCVPIGSDTYPMLSFQNGTNTLHSNAPTVNPDWELYQFLESVASTGFVLTIPDFIGFGETQDKFHPYLDKESSNKCILDMLFATKELMAAHNLKVNINDDLYITGYSMGGWATLQLQKEIEANYADKFNLKASSCAAGPYSLLYINNYILTQNNYPMPYFLGYMLNSYTMLGDITNDLSTIINEPYASKIPALFDGTNSGEQINSQLTTSISELFTENFINEYQNNEDFSSVRQTLLNNSIEAWNITTPLALLHGDADEFVPPQVSENLYNNLVNLGLSDGMVQLVTFPGIDHPNGIIPSGITSVKWFLELRDL